MISGKVRLWLIHLYPQGWRERYGPEFDMLLEQCLRSPIDVVDIFLGALDAHLQLLNGEKINWREMNKVNKLRTTLLIVFAAYIGFIIAGFALVGLADDSPMITAMKTNIPLAFSWTTIEAGAVIGLLAVVIGGFPLALTVIRRALSKEGRGLGLLLVPVFSLLALVLYFVIVFLVSTNRIQIADVYPVVPGGAFPPGNRFLLGGLMVVFVLGAIASTLAVWKVISRLNVDQENFHAMGRMLAIKIYQFAFIPAIITTLSMLVMLGATISWGWQSFSAFPEVYSGNFGPWQTSTQGWFFGIITLMSLCTLAALFGLLRNRTVHTAR